MTNSTLIELNLVHNRIGEEGIMKISEMLMNNSTLIALNLGCNKKAKDVMQ